MFTEHHITSEEKIQLWGYGPWVEEPDEIKFFKHGFTCCIERFSQGFLYAYVRLYKHPNPYYYRKNLQSFSNLIFNDFLTEEIYTIGFKSNRTYDFIPEHYALLKNPELKKLYKSIQVYRSTQDCIKALEMLTHKMWLIDLQSDKKNIPKNTLLPYHPAMISLQQEVL